ncbi:MAG: M23 family metallopeptidase [Clostridia bacterium]|nr:M23 family metallopeptidase [Clostridia bacterium]
MEKSKKVKNAKFAAFIKKNLYLILMIVCVIAIATMVAVTYATKQHSTDGVVDASVDVPTDTSSEPSEPTGPSEPSEPSEPTGTPEEAEPTVTEEIVFCMPAEGEVVGVFSNDTLVYNATLNQWSTHEAYDLAAEVGTEVKCVFDGTVKSVTSSVLRGTEVVIEHKDGLTSVYSLLGSDVTVSAGQAVKKGDVIGCIAESGTFEKHKGPHLHFELRDANGEKIDPMQYFEVGNK